MAKNDKTPAATGAHHEINFIFLQEYTTINKRSQRLQMGWLLFDLLRGHAATLRFGNINFDDRVTQNLIENGWQGGGGRES